MAPLLGWGLLCGSEGVFPNSRENLLHGSSPPRLVEMRVEMRYRLRFFKFVVSLEGSVLHYTNRYAYNGKPSTQSFENLQHQVEKLEKPLAQNDHVLAAGYLDSIGGTSTI